MTDRGATRRTALIAGLSLIAGGALWEVAGEPVWDRVRPGPRSVVPSAPEGKVTLDQVQSAARGKRIGLFTAVPAGHGDGAGLPVCMILHGASATTANFREFGLPRFLTAAVQAGARPFVLAGADGGAIRWSSSGSDDPQRMLTDELPGWLAQRGFGEIRAGWGWSMGGFGVLSYAAANPGSLRAAAAFSPAVYGTDALMSGPAALAKTPLGIWCGTEDALQPNVQRLEGPAIGQLVDRVR